MNHLRCGLPTLLVLLLTEACFDSAEDCSLALNCDGAPLDGSGGVEDIGSGGTSGSGGSSGTGAESGAGGEGGSGTTITCKPPSEGVPSNECGVFVSSSLGSDENVDAGTKEAPAKTITAAIALAVETNRVVYACAEEFDESVEVPAGVSIYGGMDCQNEWTFVGGEGGTKASIVAPADQIAVRLKAGEGETSHLEDLAIVAVDAMMPGGSSIAILAEEGVVGEIVYCDLTAGNGADGEDGAAAPDQLSKAPDGDPASNSCELEGGTGNGGGVSVNPVCPSSMGGSGGDGQEDSATSGVDGQPLGSSNSGEGIDGTCDPGGQGVSGSHGDDGAGAVSQGIISASGYSPPTAVDGNAGLIAQGGGGGAASQGAPGCVGPGGGGGGAGGCGGAGGKAGKSGGGSFGLINLSAMAVLRHASVTTSSGGNGGAGAQGQTGQPGGSGGSGGSSNNFSPGCDGGKGGKGGNGGTGGGGAGGPSIGIAYTGTAPTLDTTTITTATEAASGGLGGNNGAAGNNGADGEIADLLAFD